MSERKQAEHKNILLLPDDKSDSDISGNDKEDLARLLAIRP